MNITNTIRNLIQHLPKSIELVLKGIATYFPGLFDIFTTGGGTNSSRYCYTVWLKHLTIAYENGLRTLPEAIAELGPGDSIGVGLAALISGANKYYAFDVVEHANNNKNIEIFDELVILFKNREKIPVEKAVPGVCPHLVSHEFPNHILTDEHLNDVLMQDRIECIRNALINYYKCEDNTIQISYFVPWNNSNVIKENSIDMIYSQAVMEHIDDLPFTYKALYRWLKPGGFMSHQIDYRCHGTAKFWNGHWGYSDLVWKLIKGNRTYLINRQSHSVHIKLIEQLGFEVVCDKITKDGSGIKRKDLASRFNNMSDDDLITRGALIQAIKRNNHDPSGHQRG